MTSAGLQVDEPSIYFGELSNDYVIVRTNTREFHYPRGDDDEFTQYTGRGGVPIGSLLAEAAVRAAVRRLQIVLSDDITSESRILFNRRISDRVRALAGDFLAFDQDPYLVLADGRLYWIYDAYTTSARYPVFDARRRSASNYIRNSVKFVIDAYDGTTTAYLADDKDPIAATYARIFPGLFKPLVEMPAALREHVRYPEDIFAIQSQVYATYHMTQPAVFYNREDQWEIPVDRGTRATARRAMQPYYTIMRLPGEKDAGVHPDAAVHAAAEATTSRRGSWRAATASITAGCSVFEFPKQSQVFGPRQVVGRISQDQTISPQITLWNQQGSQVIWGTLMVIPIEESLIYVRPLYLRAQGGRIPELTRVIVAYEDQIVMEPTLEAVARAALRRRRRRGARRRAMTRATAAAPAPPGAPPPRATGHRPA